MQDSLLSNAYQCLIQLEYCNNKQAKLERLVIMEKKIYQFVIKKVNYPNISGKKLNPFSLLNKIKTTTQIQELD